MVCCCLKATKVRRGVRIWDLASKSCVAVLNGHTSIINAVSTIDESTVVSGSFDHTVRVWDLGSKSCVAVLSGNDREVNSIAKLNETTMISSSGGSNMHLWDLDIARQNAM